MSKETQTPSKKSFVYVVRAGTGSRSPIKVGVADDVQKRMKQLQTGNPKELILVMHFECDDRAHAFRLEKTIHDILKGQRLWGEWFSVSKSKVMKLLNSMGNRDDIDSIVKKMDLFDRAGVNITKKDVASVKLKGVIRSRDYEIEDLKNSISIAKKKRGAYVDELQRLGLSFKEIKELRRKATAG